MDIGGPYPFRAVAAYQPIRSATPPVTSTEVVGQVSGSGCASSSRGLLELDQ